MRRVRLATGVLVALIALVAAGCGDDSAETGRPPTTAGRPAVTVVSKSPLVRIGVHLAAEQKRGDSISGTWR